MAVAALSTAGLSQYIAASSNVSASQQAWQSLEQNLASGNLKAAQSAFKTYSQLNQNLTEAGGSSTSSSTSSSSSASQLTTDMKTLGSALSAGKLSTAQSAFATVQNDLKNSPSQAMANAESAVAQTVQWVDDLLNLSSGNSQPTTSTDPVTSMLDAAFGVNPSSNSTDPTMSILDSVYGSDTTGSGSKSSAVSIPSSGNSGSGASVNAYA
jgi:hypothetical protein